MTDEETTGQSVSEIARKGPPPGLVIDLLLALYIGAWGLAFLVTGIAAVRVASFETSAILAEWIGVSMSPTLATALYRTLLWGGIGTVLSGTSMVVVAVWFAIRNSRARDDDPSLPLVRRDKTTLALLGAVVTTVTASIPLSPILGGAVSGFHGRTIGVSAIRHGALSGGLAVLPLVFPGVALVGAAATGGFGLLAVTVVVLLAGLVVYGTVLGAVGGLVGVLIAVRFGNADVLEN